MRSGPSSRECPRCHRAAAELISLYGSQLMTSQFLCRACGALFEAIRWDDGPESSSKEDGGVGSDIAHK